METWFVLTADGELHQQWLGNKEKRLANFKKVNNYTDFLGQS